MVVRELRETTEATEGWTRPTDVVESTAVVSFVVEAVVGLLVLVLPLLVWGGDGLLRRMRMRSTIIACAIWFSSPRGTIRSANFFVCKQMCESE